MTKECLFYDGEHSCYDLLDFDPNGLSHQKLIEKIKKALDEKGIYGDDVDKAFETIYLIDVDNLEKVELLDEDDIREKEDYEARMHESKVRLGEVKDGN